MRNSCGSSGTGLTGEMLVGQAKALLMDEISTRLDSSTTFRIVKILGQMVPQNPSFADGIRDMDYSYILLYQVCSCYQQVFPTVFGIVLYKSDGSTLFWFIAAIGRTEVVANMLGAFSLLLVFVLGGLLFQKMTLSHE